ncbi:hypothetical protein BFU36_13380 [Sulfolobus sp. A20]|uniref:hypothetical protein n=1 Tax=Sulfolobaceae TaxID=118883 RepID=UPI0008461B4C|nr:MULTISPECIES: hypothetical protein [unclassified Sulfolobus]TRM74221.1 hypothetical protein DJ532_13370 [Sulfolobus sp. A20-N-F8]TRM74960.1 hypothetical protein DJ523_03810 [Sulfolobus sp. E5]TRM82136.1 hypothetical protein DJ531_09930 [Sulfolobus sp. A20-N-F6]TRM82224.1 hypothetical protein DJ524_01370 [Sulfolobus sp. D5]TRM83535.1 hypothetical protein DJ522_06115 [Sulfolobus sp. F3]TRM87068.1 hypothetical protein DJ529_09620 [Sulfolobus sp. C3]TRM94414.1 hypothetical protein DJ526_02725
MINSCSVIGKINDSNINVAWIKKKWINNFKNSSNKLNLLTYKDLGHKEKNGEGRSDSKVLYTTYLPISFFYGKYYGKNYNIDHTLYRFAGLVSSSRR